MRSVRGWGNVEWFRPDPSHIYNRSTCPWHTEYLTLLSHAHRSLCYFLHGKVEDAIIDLDAIAKIDAADAVLTQANQPSNYLRLRDGYRSGRLYATKEELRLFRGKQMTKLAQAELLFEMERWEDAIAAYDRVADTSMGGLSLNAKAYLDFARASALVFAGKKDLALKFTAGFSGSNPDYINAPSYWRAQFLVANLDRENESSILVAAYQACEIQSGKADFAVKIGQIYFSVRDLPAALKWFAIVQKHTPPHDYRHQAATRYLRLIDHL